MRLLHPPDHQRENSADDTVRYQFMHSVPTTLELVYIAAVFASPSHRPLAFAFCIELDILFSFSPALSLANSLFCTCGRQNVNRRELGEVRNGHAE